MKKILLVLFLLLSISSYSQKSIEKQTFIFAIKGQDTLRLDTYSVSQLEQNKPCVIFVFGGGFVGGTRDDNHHIPYLHHLASQGYLAVSIDYRLGIKKALDDKEKGNPEAVKLFKNKDIAPILEQAIQIAVEDLFDATNYILNHAGEWGVDKNKIIVSGSSAGAITSLQAEYAICNQHALAKVLPPNFNYAGVMAFAGAIFSKEKDLKWNTSPVPMILFHGDADANVPYNKLTVHAKSTKTTYGLFGSKYISKQLTTVKMPHYFYDVENAQHEMASQPMHKNLNEIETFIDKLVHNKEKLILHTQIKQLDKPVLPKKFTEEDYVRTNGL